MTLRDNPQNKLIAMFASGFRRHAHFWLIAPALIVLMTWPVFPRVFDFSEFWLAGNDIDSNMLFWDAWYFKRLLAGQADYFFTDLLFAPNGVSLAFHNFSLPHMALFAGLQAFLPQSNAYNLSYLILVFLTILSGYIYLLYIFRDSWAALFGAIVFGCSAFALTRPAHPNISFISTIPLSLYFIHRGLLEDRRHLMLIAGLLIGATAFIGMYSLICLLLLALGYLGCFAVIRWKSTTFWVNATLMLLVAGSFLVARFYPMLSDEQGLTNALSKRQNHETGKDLLGAFINYDHPITYPLLEKHLPLNRIDDGWDPAVFLGYIPIFLVVLALLRGKLRRSIWLWAFAALFFFLLRLGSYLSVNGMDYPHILLPKHYLVELLPQVFLPFWANDNFQAGLLLPFSMLACFGALTLLQHVSQYRRRLLLILVLIAGVTFEYYQPPSPTVLEPGRLDFVDWLKEEESAAAFQLINLPMSRSSFKIYGFQQTFTGYPHVGGHPTRKPYSAYNYIESHPLLSDWRSGRGAQCLPGGAENYNIGIQQLMDDGFTHIIVHKDIDYIGNVARSFFNVPAAYQDDFVAIYRLKDMHASCQYSAVLDPDAVALNSALSGLLELPVRGASILSILPDDDAGGTLEAVFAAMPSLSKYMAPLKIDGGSVEAANALSAARQTVLHPDGSLAANLVALIYNPGATRLDLIQRYEDWLSEERQSCGNLLDEIDFVVEIFQREEASCEIWHGEPRSIEYDNGMRLGNIVAEVDEAGLDVTLLWHRLPEEAHAFSLQIMNAAGERVHGEDHVIHTEPLLYKRINTSKLPPGGYLLVLILYNYETHEIVGGTDLSSGESFGRAWEIMRLNLN